MCGSDYPDKLYIASENTFWYSQCCLIYAPHYIESYTWLSREAIFFMLTHILQGLTVGRTSCLQTVLDLMDVKKQGSYQCPPDLLCACTDFIQSLWGGLRETAMSALRSK